MTAVAIDPSPPPSSPPLPGAAAPASPPRSPRNGARRPALLVLPLPDYAPPAVAGLGPVPLAGDLTAAGVPQPPPDPPYLALVEDDFGPRRTPRLELPAPAGWAARMGVAVLEAATGARPCPQVMRWCAPDVYEAVVRRSGRAIAIHRACRRPIRARRVRAYEPEDGVAEVSLVVEDQHRVRALALRLEGFDGRWIITSCEIG